MKGITLIGYDMNKVRHYCVRKNDSCIIGAFGLTFRFRSTVCYYAKTRVEGYFIRKENWLLQIIKNNPELELPLKSKILFEYILGLRSKINIHK